MRPIEELLSFLENQMSMQAVYQPAIILHLLTRDGVATRAELATTLSGYDEMGLEYWNQILMDNPKRWLVGKHQVLDYNKESQIFRLNFELADEIAIQQAQNFCINTILMWVRQAFENGKLDEVEVLHPCRVLELARRGEQYSIDDEANELAIEEFALQVAINCLQEKYPTQKIKQQLFNTPGFDILVGTTEAPVDYVKVKAIQKATPTFTLSEGDDNFQSSRASSIYWQCL